GPVEPGGVLALVKSSSKPPDSEKVFGDIYLISSKSQLAKTLAAKTESTAFHAFLGYAGWGPGQLEHEIELGGWHVMPAAAGEGVHSDPDSVWARLIKRTEMRIAQAYSLRNVSIGSTRIARLA